MLLARGLSQPDGAWLLPLDTRNPTDNSSEDETIGEGGQFRGYRTWSAASSTGTTTLTSLHIQYRVRHVSTSSGSRPPLRAVRPSSYFLYGPPERPERF